MGTVSVVMIWDAKGVSPGATRRALPRLTSEPGVLMENWAVDAGRSRCTATSYRCPTLYRPNVLCWTTTPWCTRCSNTCCAGAGVNDIWYRKSEYGAEIPIVRGLDPASAV